MAGGEWGFGIWGGGGWERMGGGWEKSGWVLVAVR